MINQGSAVPKYLQLAALLRQRLAGGEFDVNRRLPSQNQLAETYRLNVGTVRKALGLVRDEGLIKTYPGSGSEAVR